MFNQSDILELLRKDFSLQAARCHDKRVAKLCTIFTSGDNKQISNYFLKPTRKTLDLGLQCAIIHGNDKITETLLKKGANPLYASCAVINFKRATWPIFHRSKMPEATDSCLNSEIDDRCDDSCDEGIDHSLDDALSLYEEDDCAKGVLPVLGRATTALEIAAVIGKTTMLEPLLHRTERRSEEVHASLATMLAPWSSSSRACVIAPWEIA